MLKEISAHSPGSSTAQITNWIRTRLLASAATFNPTDKALFAGFILGDPRGQPVWVKDDFRACGLSHLLVVSGQNVAFTLAVFAPAMRKFRRRGRFFATLAVLLVFASVTRFEPSVMRAVAMATVTALAKNSGRPQRGPRVLAISVCALLLYDPYLSYSVSFGLSVGACLGLACVSPRIEPMLRGPNWARSLLSATLGAQIGTAIFTIGIFGGIPVVSVPANFVALPAAEPIMSWGIAAGVPAGIAQPWLGDWPSRIVHLPTRLCLWWVKGVARHAGSVPLGEIHAREMIALCAVVVLAQRISPLRRWFCALAVSILAIPGLALARSGYEPMVAVGKATAFGVGGGLSKRVRLVLLDNGTNPADVLSALRRSSVAAIDLVVVRSGGRPQQDVVNAIAKRIDVGAVLVGDRGFAGAVRPVIVARSGMVLSIQSNSITVESVKAGHVVIGGIPASVAAAVPVTPQK